MSTSTDPAVGHEHVVAAPSSALAGLRDRVQKAREAKLLDLEVPGLEPPVIVRFKPIPMAQITAANKRWEKSKDSDKEVLANAQILAHACVGIGDDADTIGEDSPTFDPELAEMLGLDPTAKAIDVVRALYLTDGDVIATADRVARFSGYTGEQIAEHEGN